MSGSKLSFSVAAAAGLLLASAEASHAGSGVIGLRGVPQTVLSLLGSAAHKASPSPIKKNAKVVAYGSVTTATRVLDLDALNAADFGDEPAGSDLR